jgi:hypothetical protein
MPLAAILVVSALLAMPAPAGNSGAALLFQEEQKPPAPEAPPPDSAQEPDEQNQPAAPAETPPEAKPDADKPSGAPPAASGSPEPKPAPVRPAKRTSKKRAPKAKTQPTGSGDSKVVVRNGSTSEPKIELAPGLGKQQASQQQQDTSRLLAAADANLKKLSGQALGANQQAAVKQVKTYMQQSRSATQSGDIQGAHNLALKAQLLSEDLSKK